MEAHLPFVQVEERVPEKPASQLGLQVVPLGILEAAQSPIPALATLGAEEQGDSVQAPEGIQFPIVQIAEGEGVPV